MESEETPNSDDRTYQESIDYWDGEIKSEGFDLSYKEILGQYNPFRGRILGSLKEKAQRYQADLLGLSTYSIHGATEEYTDIFQPGSNVAPYFDNFFHLYLSYGITGALYDGMNELEDLAERRGWEKVEDHLSKDENKIRWSFGILNALGVGKELILDSSMDPGDIWFNNIGFLARTTQEFDIEIEDIYNEFSSGVLPRKLWRDKANL